MPKQIACGHCGLSHGTVREVRDCALANPEPPDASAAGPAGGEPPVIPGPDRAPSRPIGATRARVAPSRGPSAATSSATNRPTRRAAPAPATVTGRSAADLAGPEALGRSVLLAPDATVPGPWSEAPVVEAGPDAAPETVEVLHGAWRRRQRLVIRWSGPPPAADERLDVAFHHLDATTEIPGERLAFAVTANAVDLLGPRPRFEPLQQAVALGAQAEGGQPPGGGDATVDGRPLWFDGGPLAGLADHGLEVPVVPRANLVAGMIRPVTSPHTASTAALAPDQLAAVDHDGGPARIIAPAGSGKTRVLTERTRHLLADRGLVPGAVALVAYNRRARTEMAERLADQPRLEIRTLNSLALGIATGRPPFTADGRAADLTTIGELDARRLLDRLVPGRRRRQLSDPLEPWVDALSACRLGLRDPDEVEAAYGADVTGFADVLPQYRAELARKGYLDFDEQILAAIERLLTDPMARRVARSVAPVLLVDEFQDLTPAHLLLVRLLTGPAAEIFAVGDDDQTIYGYSGASPRWLVEFDRFFPGAADHRLTVNYRCHPEVVTAAVNLLSHNRVRVTKTIAPGPDRSSDAAGSETGGTTPAGVPEGLTVNDGGDPAAVLVERVDRLRAAGADPGGIAILARVNAALLPPLLHLAEAGHPVARPRAIDERVLDRSGLAAALAWLRLASAPEQRLADDDLRLALRRPPRSLHPRIVDWVCEQSSVKALRALAGRLNRERDAESVGSLADDIEALRARHDQGASPGELLDEVFDTIGLLGAVSQLDQSQRTARRAAHSDELQALRAVADLAPSAGEVEGWLRDRLRSLPVDGDDADGPPGTDASPPSLITLATIHTTKGLEWDHVIVHDVRRDLHPHRLATDLEEERRIFHVGLTRGRRTVLINAVPGGGSPFVAELARPRPADEPWPEETSLRTADRPTAGAGGAGRKGPRERKEPATAVEGARRQALTEWRLSRSKADGVPAYVVIDNATLDAIAAAAPTSLVALGGIKGIGPTKLDRYGADILGVVADHPEG